ncbi:MAG: hypothetical protein ACK5M0_10790, partial [Bacteroidales bacterium]
HSGGISSLSNELKAKSWLYLVLVDTCRRRNENVETILPIYIMDRNYNVGKMVLKPLRFIKPFIEAFKVFVG